MVSWRFLIIFSSITLLGSFLPLRFLKPFRSVRFNIWLFAIIAVASSIGTFIPQKKFDIYHTWWFAGLLGLMAFDVIACKLRKFPWTYGAPRRAIGRFDQWVRDLKGKASHKDMLTSTRSVSDAVESLEQWYSKRNLSFEHVQPRKGSETVFKGEALVGGRHPLQRWGDFILHVSIVVVLTGSLIGALFGFEEQLAIVENTFSLMKNRPYKVTLADFDIEYYQSTGAPSLYASDLVVEESGRQVAQKRIVVNKPLDIKGVRFYQASWGMTEEFRSARIHVMNHDLELKPHELTPIAGTPLSIRANAFLPTFDIDKQGRPITVDYEGHNPALQVDFYNKGKFQGGVWLLKNEPRAAFRTDGDRVEQTATPPLHVESIDAILFSGIQVGYDPGAPIFWGGAISMVLGMALHFYLHRRQISFVVTPKGKGSEIFIGGWNSRFPQDFQLEFSQWVSDVKKAL